MSKLRVGLVGAGPWAQQVPAPTIAAHPYTDLVGVWVPDFRAADSLARRYGGDAFRELPQLIDVVDVVAFAIPPAAQAELAVAVAASGRHMIFEKPLAAELGAALRLVDTIERANVVALMALTRRFDPITRDWLNSVTSKEGWVGGAGRWLSDSLLTGTYAKSAWRKAHGALFDVGPHVIDLLDAALGQVDEVLWAREGRAGLWQLAFGHVGGEISLATLSLEVPVRPTVTEITIYGSAGELILSGEPKSPSDCYARMLDDLILLVRRSQTEHFCNVHRGLHLQKILSESLQKSLQKYTGARAKY